MILKKLLVLFLLYFVVGQRTGIAFNENRQVGGRWCGGRRLYPEQCCVSFLVIYFSDLSAPLSIVLLTGQILKKTICPENFQEQE
jgi:glycerol uptake facilitator-like aquaporin